MDLLTIIFSHHHYDEMISTYKWHKKLLKNLKIIWDLTDLDPEDIEKLKTGEEQENILPIKIDNMWSNFVSFETNFLTLFQKENPTYYCGLSSDVIITDDNFEKKVVAHMNKHRIFAMFPYLVSRWTDPEHPFGQRLHSVKSFQWTIMDFNILHKKALEYYKQTFITHPDFWCEIRLPSLLGEAGFHITSNPFIEAFKSFISAPGKRNEGRRTWDLPDEVIEEAILVDRVSAIHPIKNLSKKIPFIEELVLKRKNLDKKEKKD